jgi:hypothetical protein
VAVFSAAAGPASVEVAQAHAQPAEAAGVDVPLAAVAEADAPLAAEAEEDAPLAVEAAAPAVAVAVVVVAAAAPAAAVAEAVVVLPVEGLAARYLAAVAHPAPRQAEHGRARRRARLRWRRGWRRRRRTSCRRLLLNGWRRLTLQAGRWRGRRRRLLLQRRDRWSALCCARRIGPQSPTFVLVERLRCSDRGIRLDQGRRALHGNGSSTGTGRRTAGPTGTTRAAAAHTAQVFTPDLHRAGDTLRRCEHARTHAVSRHWRAAYACDKRRRNSRIDCQPSMDRKSAIDDVRLAQNDRPPVHGQKVSVQTRGGYVTGRHKDPIARIHFIGLDQVVRRQRRPPRVLIAVTPIDPSRRPFVSRDPKPAGPTLENPAPVVKDDPAPIGFDVI